MLSPFYETVYIPIYPVTDYAYHGVKFRDSFPMSIVNRLIASSGDVTWAVN